METGRPLKYSDPKELEKDIQEYFNYCDENNKPLTMSGLAYALDMDRKTLLNYSNREKFFPTIKKAKERIERFNEEILYSKDVPTVGVIFNLKNNFDWRDKQEIEANLSYEDKLKEAMGKDEY